MGEYVSEDTPVIIINFWDRLIKKYDRDLFLLPLRHP